MAMDPDWAKPIRPRGNFEDDWTELKKDVKAKMQKYTAGYKPWTEPPVIPPNIRDRPFHPNNPADTDWAIILSESFKNGGLAGLALATQYQSKLHKTDPRVNPKKNYEVFETDDDVVQFMMILASMYPGFINGLILGDVYCRYFEDPNLQSAIRLTHSLKKTPGNYLQAYIHPQYVPLEAPTQSTVLTQAALRSDNEYKYRGLTPYQLRELYYTTKKYLPSSSDNEDSMVNTIDGMFPPPDPKDVDYKIGRYKYVHKAVPAPAKPAAAAKAKPASKGKKAAAAQKGSSGNEEKFNVWLQELWDTYVWRIEKIIANDPNDPILHIPMRVSLLEIGWGKDAKARSSAHDEHRASNNLFTYYQAAVKYVLANDPRHNKVEFDVVRFATNLLNRGDNIKDAFKDGTLTDVGMTMLGRTEWFNGGLNPQPGGGAGIKEESLRNMLPYIQEQGDRVYQRKSPYRLQSNILESYQKLKEMKEAHTVLTKDLKAREAKVEAAHKSQQMRWKKIQADMESLEKANALRLTRNVVEAAQTTPKPTRQPVSNLPIVGGVVDFKAAVAGVLGGGSRGPERLTASALQKKNKEGNLILPTGPEDEEMYDA